MLLLGPCAASPDVVYIQEEHRRRRRPASVDHSEQTVNHNKTLLRKVDKTCQKYKHESALFSALFRARRAVLHDEERRWGRAVRRPRGWWAHKQTVTVKSISRFFGSKPKISPQKGAKIRGPEFDSHQNRQKLASAFL